VIIDDVKLLAPLVLSHRVFTIRGNPKDLIRKIIEETETPFSRRLK